VLGIPASQDTFADKAVSSTTGKCG